MKIISGNLITKAKNGEFELVAHGANCHHTMGAGIALQIKNNFPEAYDADLKTKYGDREKMGTYSFAHTGKLTVLNFYTQFRCGTDTRHFDYGAFRSCLRKTREEFSGKKMGFPLIGCGLAGGDKVTVVNIFGEELFGEDFTIVEYKAFPGKKID